MPKFQNIANINKPGTFKRLKTYKGYHKIGEEVLEKFIIC